VSLPKFLADENLDDRLVHAVRRRVPGIDIVRVRDAGLVGASDEDLLAWAGEEGRIVVTHDARTMPAAAHARIAGRQRMSGVPVAPRAASIRAVADDPVLIAQVGRPDDWNDRVGFLPFAD
jgi:hypothetical protein